MTGQIPDRRGPAPAAMRGPVRRRRLDGGKLAPTASGERWDRGIENRGSVGGNCWGGRSQRQGDLVSCCSKTTQTHRRWHRDCKGRNLSTDTTRSVPSSAARPPFGGRPCCVLVAWANSAAVESGALSVPSTPVPSPGPILRCRAPAMLWAAPCEMLEILVGVWCFPPWVHSLSFPLPYVRSTLDARRSFSSGSISSFPHSRSTSCLLHLSASVIVQYFVCEKTAACIVTRPERTQAFESHSVPHHRDYSDRTASHWPPGSPYPGLLYLRCIAIFTTPTPTSLLLLHQPNRLTTTSVPPLVQTHSHPTIANDSRPGQNSHRRGSRSKLRKVKPQSTHQHFPGRPCSSSTASQLLGPSLCADKKGPRPPEHATPGRPNAFVRSHRVLLAIFLVLILRYPATDSLSATYTLTYFTPRLVATVRAPTHDQLLFKVDQKNKLGLATSPNAA
ncbi:hypothetical protein EDB80DRAFT_832414 [Ilyonectria destructans]|nr:hypothetical protein EDB80DRAFT_832414 [Ilyonectria destructans]